jgi:hypothetical protein
MKIDYEEPVGVVVEGRVLAETANNLVPTLNALADKYGRAQVLAALAMILCVEVGSENAHAIVDAIEPGSFERVRPEGERAPS